VLFLIAVVLDRTRFKILKISICLSSVASNVPGCILLVIFKVGLLPFNCFRIPSFFVEFFWLKTPFKFDLLR